MSVGYSVRIAFTFVLFCIAAAQVPRADSPEKTPVYDAAETKNHIGEHATVRGTVAEVTISSKGNSFLLGQASSRLPATLESPQFTSTKTIEQKEAPGVLTFGPAQTLDANTRNAKASVKLLNYTGGPLKAMQLKIISTGSIKMQSVGLGRDIADESAWSLSYELVRGRLNTAANFSDTMKIVIYGNGPNALRAGSYENLIAVTFDMVGSRDSNLKLVGVLGSLPNGEKAGIIVGEPQQVVVGRMNK